MPYPGSQPAMTVGTTFQKDDSQPVGGVKGGSVMGIHGVVVPPFVSAGRVAPPNVKVVVLSVTVTGVGASVTGAMLTVDSTKTGGRMSAEAGYLESFTGSLGACSHDWRPLAAPICKTEVNRRQRAQQHAQT